LIMSFSDSSPHATVKPTDQRQLNLLALGLILGLGLLLYGHTLPFPFVFDDHIYLVGNPLMKDASSFYYQGDFTKFASLSRKLGLDPDLSTNFILRPVTYLTFYLNYVLDGMRPHGYRAVNIVIHLANAFLLFLLLARVLRTSAKGGARSSFSINFIALSSALLFLAHPLQIESVTYIVQRFTSLGTLFYLGTLLTYLKANEAEDRPSALRWRGASVICLILGMLVKEFLFTAPFLLLLLDCLVMGTPLNIAGRRTLPYFFCLPIIPVLILFTSQAQNEGSASLVAALNITNGSGYAPYHYALTQLSVVLTYLRLVLFPKGLNLDWDYPLTTSLWNGPALFSALTILGLVWGVWYWYRRHTQDVRYVLLFFSILWFFLTLGIDSSIVPLPDLLAEHRSYLPSIGALCALVCAADLLRTRWQDRPVARYLVPTVMVLWLLALATATNARHLAWRTEVATWEDVTSKSPKKFRPWLNLGTAYFEHGRPKDAVACIRKAITLMPTAVIAYRNLARAENKRGQYREALDAARMGIWLMPEDYEMYYEKGMAYAGLGDMKGAERALTRSTSLRPDYRPAHMALGGLYTSMKQYLKAMEQFLIADRLQPLEPQQRQVADQVARMILQQQGSTPR
jgi:Tfp pilus assembly protein PilF